MQTEAVFENISERIHTEIAKAQKSIYIVVAWFKNKTLFEELVLKANDGCSVSLFLSNEAINVKSEINFNLLKTKNSDINFVGNGNTELIHNKFCIIDNNTVITGSYNWGNEVENDFENIIITKDDSILVQQFIDEFNQNLKKYFPETGSIFKEMDFPISKIIKRLEIIKNYILLEDIDEILKENEKLKVYFFNNELNEIYNFIANKEYGNAINQIQIFSDKFKQTDIWKDPEVQALKLEMKLLENQLSAFENEKVEMEKLLSSFNHRHAYELGVLILEILKLRKILFIDDQPKFEEADKDEKDYRNQFESEKSKTFIELTELQKVEIKSKFRKAVVLCHPDKFSNESVEFQKMAEEIFKELNDANEKNDLDRITEILNKLEKGFLTASAGLKIDDKLKLKSTILRLKQKIEIIQNKILEIKGNNTYKLIVNISDWDEYFATTKQQLKDEIEKLKNQINEKDASDLADEFLASMN